jgi:ribosomal protein S18 acetylase RimI-like enzyme
MIDYRIRKATPDDIKASYDIRKNALSEYVKQTWGWDEDWQWKYHLEDFNPEILYMIEIDGVPVATLEEISEEDAILVTGIYIIDKYQSMGIGKELMKNVVADALKENKNVKLQVLKVNNRAKEFYIKAGF